MKTPKRTITTHEYCQRLAAELEQLRTIVLVAGNQARCLRSMCETGTGYGSEPYAASGAVLADLDDILATLATNRTAAGA